MLRRIPCVSAVCLIWISASAFGQGRAPWTGLYAQPGAIALREKNSYVDLTGMAKIRRATKVSGLHRVHAWILGEHGDGSAFDYHTTDFTLSGQKTQSR